MGEALLGSLFTGLLALITAVILKVVDRKNNKPKEDSDREDKVNAGIRLDLERKEKEILSLKLEIKELETDLDAQKAAYWSLFEKFMEIRVLARTILIKDGWTANDADAMLPNLNEQRKEI